MKASRRPDAGVDPRLRVQAGADVALGPGKAELLEWVQKTGSIREAAGHMDMSYMRAWTLIQTMNRCFKKPLVVTARGGERGGGAELTATGQAALQYYQEMERAALAGIDPSWQKLRKLLAKPN